MHKTILLALLMACGVGASFLLPVRAAIQPTGPYLCIVDQATGFSFDKKSKLWKPTNFAAGQKYVLKRVPNGALDKYNAVIAGGDHAVWGVWEFGDETFAVAFCADDVISNGYLWCRGGSAVIVNFNLQSLRFQRTYTGFYASDLSVPEEHADTPVIEIGKCTAI
jgi:hypothetical protein